MIKQEEMFSGFNFSSACTHRIDCITKTMPKFMIVKMTKSYSETRKQFYSRWVWVINSK